MKKSLFFAAVLLTAFFLNINAGYSGKPFEGVITYKITYPDNKFSESQMAMFPKLVTVSAKGTKSRTDLQMSGTSTVEISDFQEKTKIVLLNIMGQKLAMRKTTAEIEKDLAKAGKPTVEITSETKAIAGYTCKKAVITMNEDGVKSTFEVFYTSELGDKRCNFDNPYYKDIDGVLLEFTVVEKEMNMKFTATSVEKKSLSSKDFEIPSDYKATTPEELKSMFGGGND